MLVFRYILTIIIAYIAGRLIQKMKFPAIIGWLFTGIILGPHLLDLFNTDVIGSTWFKYVSIMAQMCLGALIGVNIRWNNLEKTGTDILTLTLSQMSGSFILVFLVASVICKLLNIPVLIALLCANISIALAPAPPLYIIKQYKTKGPLTNIIVPITVADSILSSLIFYTIICIVQFNVSTVEMTLIMTLILLMFIPIALGLVLGFLGSKFIKEENSLEKNSIISISFFVAATIIGYLVDYYLYPVSMMNYMLLGLSFVASIVNLISLNLADELSINWSAMINIGIMFLIVNISAPINIKLLFSVGWLSVIYILVRGFGRIVGNYAGSKIIKASEEVTKYCGIITLPHLGICLAFTTVSIGVAQMISVEAAEILSVVLPLAALVNEVIAIILSKKAYECAGEIKEDRFLEV